jgi:hypothetical protein
MKSGRSKADNRYRGRVDESHGSGADAMDPKIIRIMCPNISCRRVLAVPEHARGKIVRCRECGTNVRIPMPAGAGGTPGTPPPATPPRA